MNALDQERLDVLAGVRTGNKAGSAVRRRDLLALVRLPPTAVEKEDGSSVTVDRFNALVGEYLALREAINQIVARIK